MVFFILDSGSDWGQGIYLTQSQGFDTASEGRGEEGESSADSFPKKIKVTKRQTSLVKLNQCSFYIEHSSLLQVSRKDLNIIRSPRENYIARRTLGALVNFIFIFCRK